MMAVRANSLLSGVGVVIDDHVHTARTQEGAGLEQDPIGDILKQIDEAGIPVVPCDSLPKPEVCLHFGHVAFILLDWELWKKPAEQLALNGVTVGPEFEERGVKDNIAFLKALKEKECCFAPVFIFTYLEPSNVAEILRREKLLGATEDQDFILIRKKDVLKRTEERQGTPVIDAVNAWIAANPSIYVLSRWRAAVGQSQTRLFWDLYEKDHNWPGVLWHAYQGEGDDPEHGLADILLRNMRARLTSLSLDSDLVAPKTSPEPVCGTIQAVLEASMIVPDANLPAGQYGCGDIFKAAKRKYWINIRCDCDCIAHNNDDPANVRLYLLEAESLSAKAHRDTFDQTYGQTQPRASSHVLFPVMSGKALRIDFADFESVPVGELASRGLTRIGRLTPPYITQIRQRFALHLQREGLPRIPNAAVAEIASTPPAAPDPPTEKS